MCRLGARRWAVKEDWAAPQPSQAGLFVHNCTKNDFCVIVVYNGGMAASRNRNDTRNAILDATDRIMSRFGFRKMSIDDLAKEAGVSKKTIYLYFKNKEDVGLSSIDRVVERAYRMQDEIAKDPSLEPSEKLRRMLIIRVMERIHNIKDYYWSLDELFEAVRPAYMARRQAYFDKEQELISRVLTEGQRAGAFDFTDSEEAAASLLLATNAFLPYSLSMKELGDPEDIEARLSHQVDLLIKGLKKHAPSSRKEAQSEEDIPEHIVSAYLGDPGVRATGIRSVARPPRHIALL